MSRTLNLGIKSVTEKMEEIKQEQIKESVENKGELIQCVDTSPLEIEQAMRRYRLEKVKKGIRVDLDEDLHTEFKITAIRLGKTQEEWLIELVSDAVKKEKKKLEK